MFLVFMLAFLNEKTESILGNDAVKIERKAFLRDDCHPKKVRFMLVLKQNTSQ